jgi:hypothetical protein
MTLTAGCMEINLSFKAQFSVPLLQLNIHTKYRSSIVRRSQMMSGCFVTHILKLYILRAVVLFRQIYFLLIARYLVLPLRVSTTKLGHRQGATVFVNIMQRSA